MRAAITRGVGVGVRRKLGREDKWERHEGAGRGGRQSIVDSSRDDIWRYLRFGHRGTVQSW